MWIDPNTLEVARTHSDARALRPNWSAPLVLTEDMILGAGFVPVQATVPTYDPQTQKAVEQAPILVNGQFRQVWKIEPLPLPTQAEYMADLEAMYDATALQRNYDSRFTCAVRAAYDGPYRVEATAFAQWMDGCNAQAFALMQEVLAGTKPQPTRAALLAMMPQFVWPT